jgi:hypothetical protein
MGHLDDSERCRSEFKFVLRDPDERFTDTQFDRVHREILIWSLLEEVPCNIARTATGFTVTVCHLGDTANAYGLSLYIHLMVGIFHELESERISVSYIGSRSKIPDAVSSFRE